MRKFLLFLLLIITSFLIIPFLIPIPEIEGLVENKILADSNSNFVEINGVDIHYKDFGQGEITYIMLHGFGSSTYTWEKILPTLSENSRVITYDRPAFGLTERLTEWEYFNPYTPEAQRDIVIGLMDALEVQKATLVGHSAGGLVALNTYLEYPERISQLILIAPAIYEINTMSEYLRPLFRIPQINRLGPLFVRRIGTRGEEILKTTWYDPSKITEQDIEEYKKPLQIENWDVALWNLTKYTHSLSPEKRLNEIDIDVLIITGDSDTVVKTENSIRLAEEIPNAKIRVIENCGHVPQEECPPLFEDGKWIY